MTIEECSRRIRAICTYTGIPASHLPTKKRASGIKESEGASIQLAAEAAAKEVPPPPPAPTMPEPSNATKRKSPTTDDNDESFQKLCPKRQEKGKYGCFTLSFPY
ncbi:hypothetical protein CEXT_715751 [Caerostris extrusa]|uniref:Uncharacterized protein n=1 Tax=Caerostris extrusa TaxID=172846 RepID=A0AAV4N9F1_CAEEX|nr:hypothetical protein CEXT_715751 [Caerostris extrusa]